MLVGGGGGLGTQLENSDVLPLESVAVMVTTWLDETVTGKTAVKNALQSAPVVTGFEPMKV